MMEDPTITHYKTAVGIQVDAIRRSIPILQSEIAEDLKPFFHLTTLFQDADKHGSTRIVRGSLASINVPSSNVVDISFRSFDASLTRRHLAPICSSVLTIWRVQDALDSLQVFFSSDEAAVYLQTGGEALLPLLADLKPSVGQVTEAIDLFNEPILAVRTWAKKAT
jgi:hypothetical protein